MSKPSLPPGTRDFGPEIISKRNYILSTIREVLELYGYQPLETPALENLETLMGKYGEEGDKLIFKILNNGLENPAKTEQARLEFEKILSGKNTKQITERALKYDLTIPFARYVAMNHGQLNFPFKRYQIQPVWRADRPQRGRYREFYQCDADIVGSKSLMNEVELALIYLKVFEKLRISDFRLQVNHRKVLKGIIETCKLEKVEKKVMVSIDKIDKIGIEGITQELEKDNISNKKLIEILSFDGNTEEKINYLKLVLAGSETALNGLLDIEYIFSRSAIANLQSKIQLDLTLARGLDYYTGIIFEARAPESVKIGSIGGGGRYDDLTGLFGVPGIPGVGISFGIDRIYDVMEELELFPQAITQSTKVLFFNSGEEQSAKAFTLAEQLRAKGISAEVYHENAKPDKQFKYAEKKNIPFVVRELTENKVSLKNIRTGDQQEITIDNLLNFTF